MPHNTLCYKGTIAVSKVKAKPPTRGSLPGVCKAKLRYELKSIDRSIPELRRYERARARAGGSGGRLAGWPTFPLNELRLPHPSRFSKDGLQKLGDELFPVSDPQLRGALFIH